MIVNVRMKDGRTTFQFASRKDFQRVLGQNPRNLERQTCWVKHRWNEEEEWQETTVAFLNENSISFVIDANTMEFFGVPAQATADERREKFEAKKAEKEGAK